MVRRITNWIAGVVLGLSVVAWAASYAESSWVSLPGGFGVLLDSGGLYVSQGNAVRGVNPFGTGVGTIGPTVLFTKHDFVLPLWLAMMVAATVLWGMWRFGLEERRRAMVGQCIRCGYDLAGIEGVCPECGGER